MYSGADHSVGNWYLRNVCVTRSGEFVFYSEHDDNATIRMGPSSIISIKLGPNAKSIKPERMLAIRVHRGCIPSEFEFIDGVGVAINRLYVPNVAWGGGSPTKPNPGHTLADEVAAVYRALDIWGIEDNDLHVFTNDLQAIRTYGLLRLAQKPRLLTEVPKGVCFRKFISGWSLLGFMQETNPKFKPTAFPRSDLLRFRDYVWRRFGVVERPAPHQASVAILEKNVTLLSRGHASFIANTREIGVHLRDAYGVTVAYAAWETMTLKEQVDCMANADVFLTTAGGGLLNAVFMPTHSVLVVPWRRYSKALHVKDIKGRNFNLSRHNSTGRLVGSVWIPPDDIRLWFQHVPHRRILVYNPGADNETTWNDASGAIQLGRRVVSEHVRIGLADLANNGVIYDLVVNESAVATSAMAAPDAPGLAAPAAGAATSAAGALVPPGAKADSPAASQRVDENERLLLPELKAILRVPRGRTAGAGAPWRFGAANAANAPRAQAGVKKRVPKPPTAHIGGGAAPSAAAAALLPPPPPQRGTRARSVRRRRDEAGRPTFNAGERVEVQGHEEGYYGSWWAARVLSSSTSAREGATVLVQYARLHSDGAPSKPIVERLPARLLRPEPPRQLGNWAERLRPGFPLQMLHDGGWWQLGVEPADEAVDDAKNGILGVSCLALTNRRRLGLVGGSGVFDPATPHQPRSRHLVFLDA